MIPSTLRITRDVYKDTANKSNILMYKKTVFLAICFELTDDIYKDFVVLESNSDITKVIMTVSQGNTLYPIAKGISV